MDVSRVITHIEVDCWREPNGYWVQVKTKYCEATIGSGKMVEDVERYGSLARWEAEQVLEDVAGGPLPGDQFTVQPSLFTLS